MENILVQISNHPKFANRKREVCLLAENYNSGALFIQDNQVLQTFTNVTATPTTLSLITAQGKSIKVMANGANWIQLN